MEIGGIDSKRGIDSKIRKLLGLEGNRKPRPEEKKPPEINYYQMLLPGRAGQDGIVVDSLPKPTEYLQELWKKAGIYFMAGVFDIHELTEKYRRDEYRYKNEGPEKAQQVFNSFQHYLRYFYSSKQSLSSRRSLVDAIGQASSWTDENLLNPKSKSWWSDKLGVCFEMVIATPYGLYLVHLGDGGAYLKPNNGEIQLLTTPHKPSEGRVGGILAVNRTWGDGGVKRIVGTQVLSPTPDVTRLPWKNLRGASLLLTTDGLPDVASVSKRDLITQAFQSKLNRPFQQEVANLMGSWNEMYSQRKVGVSADDVSCLLLEFK